MADSTTVTNGHTVTLEGNTVTVTPGITYWRGEPCKESVWTELSSSEARARYRYVIRKIKEGITMNPNQ